MYLYAWPSFIHEVQTAPPTATFATVISIGFLVVTGSDYQQFVIAARRSVDAWLGCILAGSFLIAAGLLPATTVVAAMHSGKLGGVTDYASAIPLIMLHSSGCAGPLCLGVIMLAALGSGTALTRATGNALTDLHPLMCQHPIACRGLILALCSAIAIDGQPIVSTIISLNTIYISAVGMLFILNQAGCRVTPRCASAMMISGATFASLTAMLSWTHIHNVPDWILLLAGPLASVCLLLARYLTPRERSGRS